MKLLGTKLEMTTAHRAQADGQVERQNRVLEDSLRCMTSYHGSDWVDHLGTIEYGHATLINASTKMSLFQIDTGRIPRVMGHEATATDTRNDLARNFVQKRQQIVQQARANLSEAQQRQKKYYDQKRSSVTFAVGDMVLLSTKNLPLAHSTRGTELEKMKLAPRYIGPYKIVRMVNDNVARLELPRSMASLHNYFNIDLLKPFKQTSLRFADRPVSKTTPVFATDNEEPMYVVEKLVKRRIFNRKPEFLVKWVGLPEDENYRESEQDIKHVSHWKQLVRQLRDDQRNIKVGRMSGSSRN
ncbi:Retroelement [Phytophthora megakarya]|uniref:Retroelement n=1 Tax=Phytophthora megakarya TaxID=4795 RepID=A0A225WI12_9STRA|nr:Retroelement [Phytophthora megakarya]